MKKYTKEQIEFCLDILKGTSCWMLAIECSKCMFYKECLVTDGLSGETKKTMAIKTIKNILSENNNE